jgi:hypothetical protein
MTLADARKMTAEEESSLLQRMLDEQGFIVAGLNQSCNIGEVIRLSLYTRKYRKGWPVVVIGVATEMDVTDQCTRYFGEVDLNLYLHLHIYKCIAE